MATISGKRFQITDGASTPTNLFPYTVTEAVYGLSTVIENAKTAVTSVLSAVTLNGVSKAGTTASFYAPTTAGTTGQILKATTSGAPVWTSAALGASNKPIYLNSSGVLTEGVSCLPLTGGTIKNGNSTEPLYIDTTGTYVGAYFRVSGENKAWIGYFPSMGASIYNNASGKYLGIKDDGTPHYQGNTIWHAGNSNLNTVPWAAQYYTYLSQNTPDTQVAGFSFYHGTSTNYASGYPYGYANIISFGESSNALQFAWARGVAGYSKLSVRSYENSVWGDWKKIFNSGNAGAGYAWECTTLTASGTIASSANPAFRANFTANSTVVAAYLNGNRQWQIDSISGNAQWYNDTAGAYVLTVGANGNVGIGTTTPTQKLYVVGNIASTGDQVVSSDLTLKENLTPVTYSVFDIAKARAVEFDWKDGRGHSMGSIAQDWLSIAPALVHGEEGNMSLAYGQLALVNTIIEARAIESLQVHESEQDKEIRELRERVARLEMENERLRMN